MNEQIDKVLEDIKKAIYFATWDDGSGTYQLTLYMNTKLLNAIKGEVAKQREEFLFVNIDTFTNSMGFELYGVSVEWSENYRDDYYWRLSKTLSAMRYEVDKNE